MTGARPESPDTGVEDALGGGRQPRITFYRLIPGARPPQRADRSAAGTLPTRAFRYCEPVTSASAFGWYVFPPIDFSLLWDGSQVRWTYEGAHDEWLPLHVAQFPDFAQHFDARAPAEMRGFSPPFIAALQEPGLVQFWSGLIARTQPGWSLLVRPCANLPRNPGFEPFEGIIETDRWFGPLLTNMRLTKTDTPINFRTEMPVLQVQALPREALDEAALNDFGLVEDFDGFAPEDWDDFYDTVVRPNTTAHRPRGEYAAAARRRRRSEGEPG